MAATQMGISRQTFGRIVDAARKKVATALVEGIALRIEGGEIEMAEGRDEVRIQAEGVGGAAASEQPGIPREQDSSEQAPADE